MLKMLKQSSEILTLLEAIENYSNEIALSRSENTARTYRNALNAFFAVLEAQNLPPDKTPVSELSENAITWFASALKSLTPATEQLYLTVVSGFYKYLVVEDVAEINLPRLQMLIRLRSRRPGQRLPQFPRGDIENVLGYANTLQSVATEDNKEKLRNLRDRAFLLTLADTGLRVHEACGLRRGNLDWNEGKAIVIGKGDREAIVRFSNRSLEALKDYLGTRAKLDGASGRALSSLPLFARHDRGAGKKVKPITTATGRNIVSQRVKESLGAGAVGTITPHSFRHYFVTTILLASQGNLKLAQKLARHRNISVTQRYAHLTDDELDRGYWEVFEEDKRA